VRVQVRCMHLARCFLSDVRISFENSGSAMADKHYKPEEIVAKLRQVEVLVSQGQNIVDAIRQIGVSELTYYRWRREFGGLNAEHVRRLKDLESQNARLRKAVSDLTLDKLILQEVRAQLHLSEPPAGAPLGQDRSTPRGRMAERPKSKNKPLA
jgi:putative transposase